MVKRVDYTCLPVHETRRFFVINTFPRVLWLRTLSLLTVVLAWTEIYPLMPL